MAYTRLSDSNWYAHWSSTNSKKTQFRLPTKKLKRGQVLEISDFPSLGISYGELQDLGLGNVLDHIRNFYYCRHGEYDAKRPSQTDMHEMIDILNVFETDVNEHFRFWTFMKYQWWLPIRNKLRISLHK